MSRVCAKVFFTKILCKVYAIIYTLIEAMIMANTCKSKLPIRSKIVSGFTFVGIMIRYETADDKIAELQSFFPYLLPLISNTSKVMWKQDFQPFSGIAD